MAFNCRRLHYLSASNGKVIQVNQRGNDTRNCGAASNPCKSLKSAILEAQWNDVIEIVAFRDEKNGIKPVNFCLNDYYGHRIEKNLTVKGVQGRPIIDCNNIFMSLLFYVESKNKSHVHFTIENMEMRNSSSGLIIIIGATVKATGCKFTEIVLFSTFEISASKTSDKMSALEITNCTFANCGNGILVSKYSYLCISISNTKFLGNKINSEGVNIKQPDFFSELPWPAYLSITVNDSLFKWNMFGLIIQELSHQSNIHISNTTFEKNRARGLHGTLDTGSGMRLTKTEDTDNFTAKITLSNCRFIDNEANVGAGISLWYDNKVSNATFDVNLNNVYFINNKAQQVSGAVHLHVRGDKNQVTFESCQFAGNQVLATDKTSRLPVLYFPALTGAGGAIYQAFGNTVFKNCEFIDNVATIIGGSIASSSNITVISSRFLSSANTAEHKDVIGKLLYMQGNAKLVNTSFHPHNSSGEQSYFWFKSNAFDNEIEATNVTFICPPGHKIRTTRVASYATSNRYYILAYYCDPCQIGTYSLTEGREAVNGKISVVTNPNCERCPFGATCQTKVSINKDFWGYTYLGEIRTVQCPSGYCCNKKHCEKLKTCASVRIGKLCGRCSHGYSENLVDNKCTKNEQCSQWWVIFIILILAIVYCCFFLFIPEILRSVQKFLFPYKTHARKHDDKAINKMGVDNDSCVPSLFGVVLYFYQLQWLVQIQGLNEIDYVSERIRNIIIDILSLQPSHHLSYGCPMKGLTPVTKQLFKTSFNIFVFVILLVIYAFQMIKMKILNKSKDERFLARLCRASIMLILLNIVSLANSSLAVVHCIDLSNKKVLYIDGEVDCYQIWQYIMMAYFIFCVLPVILVLCFETTRVLKKTISIRVFMLNLILPPLILVIVFWRKLSSFVTWMSYRQEIARNRSPPEERSGYEPAATSDVEDRIVQVNKDHNSEDSVEKDGSESGRSDENNPVIAGTEKENANTDEIKSRFGEMCEIRNAIIDVLAKPYLRKDKSGPVYWEGVLLLRRLTIVVFNVFIHNELIRQYVTILFFLVNLLIHQAIGPFRHRIVNLAESASLALLIFVNAINIFFAHYLIEVEQPSRYAESTSVALRWTLFAISATVPATLASSLLVALITRIGYSCALVLRCMNRRRRQLIQDKKRLIQNG